MRIEGKVIVDLYLRIETCRRESDFCIVLFVLQGPQIRRIVYTLFQPPTRIWQDLS